ncbi:MAG TPA: ECF-type sigma factor [Bryobacteraceae bacterium]|nr:ECF-type sigma factor [Bryobacteraceae bacterium]
MPESAGVGEITLFLKRLSAGDASAETPLAEAVYAEIRTMAGRIVNGGQQSQTLQATSLVNEVLLELVRLRSVDWQDRRHFFRTAARMLRRRFIDHIRRRQATKRPSSASRIELEDLMLPTDERFDEILGVDQALNKLAEFDPDLAELVELVYFGGCSKKTIAELRNVSEKTITRHLGLAERWLKPQLSSPIALQKSASIDGA